MKKLIGLFFVALLGFYAVWPAWSMYRLAMAVESSNVAGVEAGIDFPQVRAGLRDPLKIEIAKQLDQEFAQKAGPLGGLISSEWKQQIIPIVTDTVLNRIVTAESVVRIAKEGGDAGRSIKNILVEQLVKAMADQTAGARGAGEPSVQRDGLAGLGGLAGLSGVLRAPKVENAPAQPANNSSVPAQGGRDPAKSQPRTAFGLSNIKSVALEGPAAFRFALAQDPAAEKPDVAITVGFTGGTWKLTKVVPML